MTTPAVGRSAEVTGLGSAQAYAAGMQEAYTIAAARAETFASGLDGYGVCGPAVAAVTRAQDLTRQASEAWTTVGSALGDQHVVRDAYAAAPEAGGKQFLTDQGSTSGSAPDSVAPAAVGGSDGVTAGIDAAVPAPVTVDAFVAATLSTHPQRPPVGQDLQHRMRDAEGGDSPWVSLPAQP